MYQTFSEFDWYKITTLEDDNVLLFAVLINGVYNKKFNLEFLNNFDSFELYKNWQLNIKLADWLTNNLHFYF